jgi:hypothetical protein
MGGRRGHRTCLDRRGRPDGREVRLPGYVQAVMNDVRQVLDRQLGHSRRGFHLARARPEVCAAALGWLAQHPSGMPDVDACWREALSGDTDFARFLETDAPLERWSGDLPLRCLVSSHPFPDLWRWSIPL